MKSSSEQKKPGTGLNTSWRMRMAWEAIEHLASTAMKMLEEPSTKDLAPALISRVQKEIDYLQTVTQTPEETQP